MDPWWSVINLVNTIKYWGILGKLTDFSGHGLSCPSERPVDVDEISLEKVSHLVQRIVRVQYSSGLIRD